MLPAFGVPLSTEGLSQQSRALFDLDFRYIRLNPSTGAIPLPSGHTVTYDGISMPSIYDANGATYTVMTAEPGWEQRDWDGDGVRESFGVYASTSSTFTAPSNLRPMAMCGLLEMIETGRRTTANSCFFAHDAANISAHASFYIATNGTYYQMKYHNGSTLQTALLASGAAAAGDRVRFTWELSEAGALTFRASINEGADIVATAAAAALPAAWEASSSWRLNYQGYQVVRGTAWYRRCKVVAGYMPLEQLIERR